LLALVWNRSAESKSEAMLYNYLKIAIRNLVRNKVYSFINIFGLALGVACCLLLALYIQDEVRVDKHHRGLENIYRIITRFESERGLDKLGTTSPPIAMTLMGEIGEIESAARVLNPPGVGENLIRYGENVFYESDGFIADSTIFDVLTFDFIEGNRAKSLTGANSVVISEHLAKKLFNDESALNKVISITQGGVTDNFTITGVYGEKHRSHLKINFIISMMSSGWAAYIRTDPEAAAEWAGNNFVPAYLKLIAGHDKAAVERKMNEVLNKYGAEDMKALGMKKSLSLEPLKDIYLMSDVGRSPRITYLYVIASIALFILLIACINFMNLSTAKAGKRAAEIGIRKVMGAYRGVVVRQLLGETMVIVVIAIVVSLVIVQAGLPYFNDVTGKAVSLETENLFYFSGALLLITLITGMVAGSYPAFYLSSFEPAQVLKGKWTLGNASGLLRQSLVVFQFMIAIILVCGMIIIGEQLTYMQEKELGFDAKAKLVLPLRTRDARQQYEALKKELQQNSSIISISATNYIPGTMILSDMLFYPDGGSMETAVLHRRNQVDAGYMNLMDMTLIAGRPFTGNIEMERRKVIANETSVRKLGMTPEQIIGQNIHFEWHGEKVTFEVIGVMKDYHQTSLKEAINPTLFELADAPNRYAYLVAAVNTTNIPETIAFIESTWKRLIDDTPLEYSFLDASLQKQYNEDRKVSGIITTFTVIAMIICALGLYGLSTYMAERRFKEIGVRKVLGASINQIMGMMSQEFIRLVAIAFVIATPIAWYAMTRWLESFAYHVPVQIEVFVYAGLASLVIAIITVSYQSYKAASVNPVNSLRTE
jgi:putative ABC transport system permease protein